MKVGIFVTLGVGLVMVAILMLGGVSNWLTTRVQYHSYYDNVDGLIPGSKVVLNGIRIGTVETVEFDSSRRQIAVHIEILEKYSEWMRMDTLAEVQTQGVLGDKYVSLTTPGFEEPKLPPGSEIKTKVTGNLKQFIDSGEQLLGSLNDIASGISRVVKTFEKNGRSEKLFDGLALTAQSLADTSKVIHAQFDQLQLRSAVNHMDSILAKIDKGQGTLGALINDPSLYDDVKLLMGGANRNRVVRNLIRQTIKDGEVRAPNAESNKASEKP